MKEKNKTNKLRAGFLSLALACVFIVMLSGCEFFNGKLPSVPTNSANQTPAPTISATPGVSATPTNTPSPTPTQSLREQALAGLEKTGENGIFIVDGIKLEKDGQSGFAAFGDNYLVATVKYPTYSDVDDVHEDSKATFTLFDPINKKIIKQVEVTDKYNIALCAFDNQFLLFYQQESQEISIYDVNLEKCEETIKISSIEGFPFYDVKNRTLYYSCMHDFCAYDFKTSQKKVIKTYEGYFYLECKGFKSDNVLVFDCRMDDTDNYESEYFLAYLNITDNSVTEEKFDDGVYYEFYYSPDGSEYIKKATFPDRILELRSTADDSLIKAFEFDSGNIEEGLIDWKNRVFVTYDTDNTSNGWVIAYSSYSMTTGELISDCAIRKMIYGAFSPLLLNKYGLMVSTNDCFEGVKYEKNSPESLYYWDYLNDGVEDKSSYYPKLTPVTHTFSDELEETRKSFEEKYGVKVYMGYETQHLSLGYKFTVCEDESDLQETFAILNKAFGSYPEGFFEQFKYGGVKTLGIYLCNDMTNLDPDGVVPIGLASQYYYERMLVLDVSMKSEVENTIYHEVSHWIDSYIESVKNKVGLEYFDEAWNELNPKGYSYANSYYNYIKNHKYTYTWEDDSSKVYFIDSYCTTFATEDRARMFEHVMSESMNYYATSENIVKKIKYYFEAIRVAFDTTGWPEKTSWETQLEKTINMHK